MSVPRSLRSGRFFCAAIITESAEPLTKLILSGRRGDTKVEMAIPVTVADEASRPAVAAQTALLLTQSVNQPSDAAKAWMTDVAVQGHVLCFLTAFVTVHPTPIPEATVQEAMDVSDADVYYHASSSGVLQPQCEKISRVAPLQNASSSSSSVFFRFSEKLLLWKNKGPVKSKQPVDPTPASTPAKSTSVMRLLALQDTDGHWTFSDELHALLPSLPATADIFVTQAVVVFLSALTTPTDVELARNAIAKANVWLSKATT